MTSQPIRQACILVGGKGTRLGDLTRTIPKPLVDIGEGKTFLDVVIEEVARQGFHDIVLLAGYLGHIVRERYDGRDIGAARVRVIVEPKPLGTGGALVAAREIVAPYFLLLNGDTFFDINLRALCLGYAAPDREALIALHRVSDTSRYGSVVLDGERVEQFVEKKHAAGPGLINGGAYVLAASIVNRIHALPCSIETDIFPTLAAERRLRGRICEGYFIDIGLPETLQQARHELIARTHRPAAFLDRDGVINVDSGYVHRPDLVEWIPGAPEAIRRLNELGYRVVVVTNQAGVAHGYYREEDIHSLHAWMQDQLAAKGAFIDAFYYSPYHPEGRIEKYRQAHFDRKPEPGMILRAIADLHIDREGSFLIGDKETDIEAARRAGIRGLLFTCGNLAEFLDNSLDRVGKP
jgi:D,D-heptose 1,7-bisphosphate phosphatase